MRYTRFLAVALFVTGAVVVVEAQQPGGRRGGFGQINATSLVISNKDLQAELKVTDAQKEKFKDVLEKQQKMAASFKGGGFKNLDKEKQAERAKEGEELNAEIKKVVEATLTPDQLKRLKEIDRQALGVRAFTNEEVIAELKLSDDQKTKVKGIAEEYAKDVRELGGG